MGFLPSTIAHFDSSLYELHRCIPWFHWFNIWAHDSATERHGAIAEACDHLWADAEGSSSLVQAVARVFVRARLRPARHAYHRSPARRPQRHLRACASLYHDVPDAASMADAYSFTLLDLRVLTYVHRAIDLVLRLPLLSPHPHAAPQRVASVPLPRLAARLPSHHRNKLVYSMLDYFSSLVAILICIWHGRYLTTMTHTDQSLDLNRSRMLQTMEHPSHLLWLNLYFVGKNMRTQIASSEMSQLQNNGKFGEHICTRSLKFKQKTYISKYVNLVQARKWPREEERFVIKVNRPFDDQVK